MSDFRNMFPVDWNSDEEHDAVDTFVDMTLSESAATNPQDNSLFPVDEDEDEDEDSEEFINWGFGAQESCEDTGNADTDPAVCSVVQVYFPARGCTLAYYNDQFDLHCGDFVYVDGKLKGILGRVTEVNYHFKIRLSDYKRVLSVANVKVNGTFHAAGSHLICFTPHTLPFSQVISWYRIPEDESGYAVGRGGNWFPLNDLSGMNLRSGIAERGHDYYLQSRVKYLSIQGTKGRAIVQGSSVYTVEFEYANGEIGNIMCDCFCSYSCKHEVAVLLQLRESLEFIQKNYAEEWEKSYCFCAVCKSDFFSFVMDGMQTGSFTVD